MSWQHYTYRTEWSPEDDEWVGLVAEFPSLSWLDPDPVDAMRGIRDLVEGVVADMRESGEIPPTPLADRRYSGKVFVRTTPDLHRRLTIEAAEQGVSVNQWAMQKLAERSGDLPKQHHAASEFEAAFEAVRDTTRKIFDSSAFYEQLMEHLDACWSGLGKWRPDFALQTGSLMIKPGLLAELQPVSDFPIPVYFKATCKVCDGKQGDDGDPAEQAHHSALAEP